MELQLHKIVHFSSCSDLVLLRCLKPLIPSISSFILIFLVIKFKVNIKIVKVSDMQLKVNTKKMSEISFQDLSQNYSKQ